MDKNYITISALNRYLKFKFDEDIYLQDIYLKGEISNFKPHTRGHYYFTLKDEESRINAVMFASSTKNLKFRPSDGMRVLVRGKISVYPSSGSYQIYVSDMDEDGLGNLYVAFEQLKEKLSKEGFFDKKRPIPKIPKRVGIITAPTGAAIRDILTTIKRRFPLCETILFPALVQGTGAKEDIARKIEIANSFDIDVLIVGRGGGSIEDLWAFNEEIVARAIYNSRVPTISAVGHEIDFTIADFVADLRAPTPTAAAELAVPNKVEVMSYLDNMRGKLGSFILNLLSQKRKEINNLRNSYVLVKPSYIYEIKEQNLDNLIDRLNNSMNSIVEINRVRLFKSVSSYILSNPETIFKYKRIGLENMINKLEVLNPLNTLKRGYSIVKMDGKVISDASAVKRDSEIDVQFKNGVVKSKVIEIEVE